MSEDATWSAMAAVGRIARAHGLRGQVILNVDTDFPEERFRPGAELFVRHAGRVEPMIVETVRFHRDRPVIAFRGIDTIDAAEALAGRELRVPVERLAVLPAGTFYRHDLVGCRVVTTGGVAVGVVIDVEGTEAGSRLVIEGKSGEVLVPFATEICPEVDPAAKRIVIDPPDGLVELNAKT